jgi:hypothetical protein
MICPHSSVHDATLIELRHINGTGKSGLPWMTTGPTPIMYGRCPDSYGARRIQTRPESQDAMFST